MAEARGKAAAAEGDVTTGIKEAADKTSDVSTSDDTTAKLAGVAEEKSAAAPPRGRLIRAGEEITLELDTVETDPVGVTKENVWQEFFPENSLRPSYRLLYTKGQQVNLSDVEAKSGLSKNYTQPEVK